MKIRYKLSLLLIGLMLIGCLYVGQSYALWIMTDKQTNENEVEVGCFSIGFSEQSESINLNNTYPMSDSLGLSSDPYTFTITNTCTINNSYVVTLNTINTNTLDTSKIKYALYKSSEAKPEVGSKLSRINTDLENLKVENLGTSYILDTGVLKGGTKVDGEVSGGEEVTYNLYLWIDDIAGNEVEGQTFEASINIINSAIEDSEEESGSLPADEYIKTIATVESGDGLYTVSHEDLEELGQEWNKTEYRFGGVDPVNYVSFNNELWRIIGLVNVKVGDNVEQRVKIVRTDGVKEQKAFGNYAWDNSSDYFNNWTTSKLKDMLNGIYYESSTGECYIGDSESTAEQSTCDFNTGIELPKGLDETAREMIDKEVTWNIGGWSESDITANQFYEKERSSIPSSSNDNPIEWSSSTDVGGKHNGIGLMYPSDYGYAVGGDVRNNCLSEILYYYEEANCYLSDWLKPSSGYVWTLSPVSTENYHAFYVDSSGYVAYDLIYDSRGVWPVAYLKSSVKIAESLPSDKEYGSIDNPFQLIDVN